MKILRKLRIGTILSSVIFLQPTSAGAFVQLVESGVSRLADNSPNVDDPTVLWATAPECNSNPDNPSLGVPGDELHPALISRASLSIATPRVIFSFNPSRPVATCNSYKLLSNIRAIGPDLYFVDNQGPGGDAALWRLPRDANPGDAPHMLADLRVVTSATVVEFGTDLAVSVSNDQVDRILQYDRETGQLLAPIVEFAEPHTLDNLQFDGRFLYWTSRRELQRFDTRSRQLATFGTVQALYPEGYDEYDDAAGHHEFSLIIYSQGNKVYEADTLDTSTDVLLYTSPVATAQITAIARARSYYFFIERRAVNGGLNTEERIFRYDLFADQTDLIYGPIQNGGAGLDGFHTDRTWLYFRDAANDSLLRLPNDEAAITMHDLRATALEITQGLQDAANHLRLIADKRTIVRFSVRSGKAEDVYGVTASLAGSTARDGFLGRLEPINTGGKLITVRQNPTRTNLDQSFQFELPRKWTNGGHLSLTATVNPAERVIEDTLANNSAASEVDFTPNERLFVIYFNFSYDLGGTRYTPALADVAASRLRMQRLYPLGEHGIGFASQGLHTVTVDLVDNKLTAQVDRTDPDCVKRYTKAADRNMCASDYVHGRIAAINQSGGVAPDVVSYANIAQAPAPMGKSYFTRGYANGQIASGPSTNANYASHEVGHTLGRSHPTKGSLQCGHSASDDSYPYTGSLIAKVTDDNTETRYAGLDFGDMLPGVMTYLDASMQFDTMSYCSPNWISDYTFEGMYQYLISPTRPRARALRRAVTVGDWLILSGTLTPEENAGGFTVVQRTSTATDTRPPPAGAFALELRNRAGGVLATYPFTGIDIEDQPGKLAFDLVVAFIPGTAELRVVDTGTGNVLASHTISANPPLVSDVQLAGAPDPVDGMVTVTWNANDPDGDALRFDLFASRNGDPLYRPIQLGIAGTSVALDTTLLGGGMNKLRVVASDGAQTAYAESKTFTVPPRKPRIIITSPVNGYHADWGQLVSLQAEVDDIQDDDVLLVSWSGDKAGAIGAGPWVQTDQLPVGENTVTVTATNSLGASASAAVKVVIGDLLSPPGPTLSVAPQTIAWHVAAEDTTVQSMMLNVDNHGTDTLQFDVSSDADWLLIDSAHSVTGASAPRTLTIIAYPTMVPAGVTSHATLTVRNTAEPNDEVSIPVQLSRGNVFDHTGESLVACTGDCDGDGAVTIDELIHGVNIALGSAAVNDCTALDVNADGEVTIDELLRAVNAALQGC